MLTIAQTKEIWKTGLLPVVDFVALLSSAALAYAIRYLWYPDNFTGQKQIYGQQYLTLAIFFSLTVVLIYAMLGQYKVTRKPTIRQSFVNINIGLWLVLLGIITYLYFNEFNPNRKSFGMGGILVSRFIIGTVGIVAIAMVLLGRGGLWILEQLLYRFGKFKTEAIIIGNNQNLKDELQKRLDIAKVWSFEDLNSESYLKLVSLIESLRISEIYLLNSENNEHLAEITFLCERYKIRFLIRPQFFGQLEVFKLEPLLEYDLYWFEVHYTSLFGWKVITKRLFDLVVSVVFLILFSWLYLLIAILIKLDSKGPVFYASERVAPNGKVFKMFKFRRFKQEFNTSELNPKAKAALEFEQKLIAEQGQDANRGALYKIKDDPRMTKLGKFLEQASLDELPQFFNVIVGNLSLVGPRAHQPREVKKYHRHHYKVLNIKPGITGLAQIKGRSDLHFEDEVKFDTFYVENWSFYLDIKILFLTPWIILVKRHKS